MDGKGRQDRDGIHEAWLMSMLTPPTPSHNPFQPCVCVFAWGRKRKESARG